MSQSIKSLPKIVCVIGLHVALTRVRSRYKGLCPFHKERTASFTVDPDRNRFHCFGCHAHGTLEDFLARIANRASAETL